MKIDEAAFERAFGSQPRGGLDLAKWEKMRATVAIYLAELPEPEPALDRIAVVVDANGYAVGWSDLHSWTALEDLAVDEGSVRPLRRVVVGCDLGRPVPVEPVEVDGSVEETHGRADTQAGGFRHSRSRCAPSST